MGYGTHLVIHPVIRIGRDADGTLLTVDRAGRRARRHGARVDPPRRDRPRARPRAARRPARRHRPDARRRALRRRGLAADAGLRRGADRGARRRAPCRSTPTIATRPQLPALARTMGTSRSSATGSMSWSASRTAATHVAELRGARDSGTRDPARRAEDADDGAEPQRAAARACGLAARADEGELAGDRPSRAYLDYVGVKRYGAGRRGDRRAPLPRAVHNGRVPREPAGDPRDPRQGALRAERAGFPPDSHDAKALDRDLRDLPARLAVADRPRRAVPDRDGDPRASASASGSACSRRPTCSSALSPASSAFRATVSTPRTADEGRRILRDAFAGSHFDWTCS